MQGDIETVAGMTPRELTAMFEVISGSDACKQRYDAAAAASREADLKLQACHAAKKNVVAERKAKGEQKAEAEKHLAKASELVRSFCRESSTLFGSCAT